MMHQDGGDTDSTNYPAPIGKDLSVTTLSTRLQPFLFDSEGNLTAGGVTKATSSTNMTYTINAVDPSTLEILSSWTAPAGQVLNFAYMQLALDSNEIVATSKAGHIYVIQRDNSVSPPSFQTLRDIDLTSYLAEGETLLNSQYDSKSNIWFTTGLILSIGETPQNTSTLGYVSPSGDLHVIHLPGLTVENGIAVSGETAFIATGPAAGITTDTNGTLSALRASSSGSGIEALWEVQYDAGSDVKIGDANRGTGTSPALLGDAYIAITDNADEQISLLIYHQDAQCEKGKQLLCTIPIFEKGKSACDNAPIAHVGENGYEVFVLNDYNAPPFYPGKNAPQNEVNGAWNNVTNMAPGGIRVDVPFEGNACTVKWEKDIRMPSVPTLSTKTGLLYGYEQDVELSYQGEWVWYVTARDWQTGELVWRVRTGTGGTFNDNFEGNAIFPDGRLVQAVVGGLVFVTDEGLDMASFGYQPSVNASPTRPRDGNGSTCSIPTSTPIHVASGAPNIPPGNLLALALIGLFVCYI
jgi:hypothetical protein